MKNYEIIPGPDTCPEILEIEAHDDDDAIRQACIYLGLDVRDISEIDENGQKRVLDRNMVRNKLCDLFYGEGYLKGNRES